MPRVADGRPPLRRPFPQRILVGRTAALWAPIVTALTGVPAIVSAAQLHWHPLYATHYTRSKYAWLRFSVASFAEMKHYLSVSWFLGRNECITETTLCLLK